MKLSGSKRGGKHVGNGGYSGDSMSISGLDTDTGKAPASGGKLKKNGKRKPKRTAMQRILRFAAIFLLIVAALTATVLAVWKATVKPPDLSGKTMRSTTTSDPYFGDESAVPPDPGTTNSVVDGVGPTHVEHNRKKFSFVVLGIDYVAGLSDTIMVAMFDTESYKFNVMNIPRDTLVNINGRSRKVNEMYGAVKGDTLEEKMEAYKASLQDIIGFMVDYYVIVDLDAFRKLVDGIGGVDFYVPVNMDWDDPGQNLSIHITKGQKHLNGADALKVVRFRGSYAQGDIKRIEVQQDFLLEAAKQILDKRDSVPWMTLIDVFLTNVKTDLQMGNLVWFAQEFLKMDAENISLTTIPADYFGNRDYVIIRDIGAMLDFVNENLNPWSVAVTKNDVNIPTSPPGGSSNSSGKTNSSGGTGSSGNSGSSGNTGNSSGNSGGNTGNTGDSSGGSTPGPDTTDPGVTDEPSIPPDNTSTGEPPDVQTPPDTEPPMVSEPPPESSPSPEQTDNGVVIPAD